MSKEKKLVAKLVTFTFTARVIVEENADEDTIIEQCDDAIVKQAQTELFEHFVSIEEDKEVPFGSNPFDLGKSL